MKKSAHKNPQDGSESSIDSEMIVAQHAAKPKAKKRRKKVCRRVELPQELGTGSSGGELPLDVVATSAAPVLGSSEGSSAALGDMPTSAQPVPNRRTGATIDMLLLTSGLAPAEICALSSTRSRMAAERVIKTLRENGAGEQEVSGCKSLLGLKHPVAIPRGANINLREFGQSRFRQALLDIVYGSNYQLTYSVFENLVGPDGEPLTFDLRGAKRALEPQLKEAGHFAFTAKPIPALTGLGMSVRTVTLQTRADTETARMAARKRRQPRIPMVTPTRALTVEPTDANIEAVAAAMWGFGGLDDEGPFPPAIGMPTAGKIKASVRRQEWEPFRLQAQMALPKLWYGYGVLKKLVRSVLREVDARAGSLDLAGRAPIQPEAVASFLAALPARVDGQPAALPVARLL